VEKRVYIHTPELPNTMQSLDNICKSLIDHGLAEDSQIIICCSKGFSEKINRVVNDLPNYFIYEYDSGPETWEFPTLYKLYLDAFDGDYHCLYLHCKGGSKVTENSINNALAWQNIMLYGVIENYKYCIEHLNSGANLVGSLWYWHFKGNYWWSDSRYIRTLLNPLMFSADRLLAEQWCSFGCKLRGMSKPKIKNLFYLRGLENDDDFVRFKSVNEVINLKEKPFFADKRIDNSQGLTASEFLGIGLKCALDQINIIAEDYHLIPELTGLLNYNGVIQVVDSPFMISSAEEYKSIFEYFQVLQA